MLTFSSAPNHVWDPPQGLGEQAKVTLPLRTARLNKLTFLKSQPTLPVRDVIHVPQSHFLFGFSTVTSLNDTSAPRAR